MTSQVEPISIIVIDDDPVSMEFLAPHLTAAGYKPLVARDAAEVLAMLQARQARVVISDWIMPQTSGLELCRAIRSRANSEYVYFIMLTVLNEPARLAEAFAAGVDDFISKPFNDQELMARLHAAVRMISVQDELRRDADLLAKINRGLAEANDKLKVQAMTDELTGLPNRRYAMMRLKEEWAVSERHQQPLTCAAIDVDGLKRLNDLHGHPAGDCLLQKIARILKTNVRAGDVVCRIGGDEFLILFHNQTDQAAAFGAERCRAEVERAAIGGDACEFPATLSVGIARKTPGMAGPEELLRKADNALYAAKQKGRNNVCLDGRDVVSPVAH